MRQITVEKAGDYLAYGIVVICTFTALGITLQVTDEGIGISPDSVSYIAAARNFASGEGLSVLDGDGGVQPMTHYPPLFPLVLSSFVAGGMEASIAARWLNAICFSANVLLVALLARTLSRSLWASALASFLAVSSVGMLCVHTNAWSEPLFLLLMLLGCLLLIRFLRYARYELLVLSGLAFGMAYACRYAGAAFIGGAMVVLLVRRSAPGRRLVALSIFTISVAPFVAVCILRNAYVGGPALGRHWGWDGLSHGQIVATGSALSSWLAPVELPVGFRVTILGVALAAIAIWIIRAAVANRRAGRLRQRAEMGPAGIALVLAGSYEALLLLTALVFDPGLDMGIRMHVPAFLLVLIVGMQVIVRAFQGGIAGVATCSRVLCGVLVGILILSYATGGLLWINTAKDKWLWYSTRNWRGIPEMDYLRDVNTASVPVYSNAPDYVYYCTGNTRVYRLPKGQGTTPQTNAVRERNGQITKMLAQLEKEGGVVVYLQGVDWRDTISNEDLQRLDGLLLRSESPRAALYTFSNLRKRTRD